MPSLGTTGQRGYGLAHKAERKRWEPKVDAGLVDCRRCGQPLEPGRPWDLGHPDADCPKPKGPEHMVCNRSAGGKNGALVTNAMRGVPRRVAPVSVTLTVVIGPPASGKSTWVLERAKPGDIVIDFDRLAVALTGEGGDPHDHPAAVTAVARAARSAAIDAALKTSAHVYLIHSSPGQQRMAEYRAMGAEVVTIDPGRDVVRQRCKGQRPQRMYAVIDEWYREQGQAPRATQGKPSPPVFAFPAVGATSREW
jgi:hypothetical protein